MALIWIDCLDSSGWCCLSEMDEFGFPFLVATVLFFVLPSCHFSVCLSLRACVWAFVSLWLRMSGAASAPTHPPVACLRSSGAGCGRFAAIPHKMCHIPFPGVGTHGNLPLGVA